MLCDYSNIFIPKDEYSVSENDLNFAIEMMLRENNVVVEKEPQDIISDGDVTDIEIQDSSCKKTVRISVGNEEYGADLDIKIHSYNCVKGHHTGKCFGTGETSAKLKITFRDTSGRWICQFNAKSKEKLKLGNDHRAYRVYIACRQDLGSAANWTNMGKCTHWGVEAVSNCHF